jgi:hypothetical protein
MMPRINNYMQYINTFSTSKNYSFLRSAVVYLILCIGIFIIVKPCFSESLLRQKNPWLSMPVTVLQGLDKITARVSTFEILEDNVGYFGTLNIKVRSCKKRPPMEPPERAAFVEIVDHKPGEDVVKLFTGWMFASSPGLSGLEHPVYDIWILDCKNSVSNLKSLE